MKGEVAKLKLGKGALFFVKTQLRRLARNKTPGKPISSPFRVQMAHMTAFGGDLS